jgi:2-polyprenyl-6-methoxyphenol hydroxylase-like FAD-dependent oxidoreductase
VYAHSLTGVQLHRVDHFSTTSSLYWEASPANIGHLAQSKVEAILREEVASYSKDKVSDQDGSVLFMKGYNVSGCTVRRSGGESEPVHVLTTAVGCTPDTKHLQHDIECRFLVGADGANSTVRKMLGIPMVGEEAMQHLVNVHFTCPGLRAKLLPRSGMLYFIFNEVRTTPTTSSYHFATVLLTCVRCMQAHLDDYFYFA